MHPRNKIRFLGCKRIRLESRSLNTSIIAAEFLRWISVPRVLLGRGEGIIIFCRARHQRQRATISKSLNYRRGHLLSEERHLIYTEKCCYKWERTVRSLKRFWSGVACVINKGGTEDESDTGARGSVIMMSPSLPLLSSYFSAILFSWRIIFSRDSMTTWLTARRI